MLICRIADESISRCGDVFVVETAVKTFEIGAAWSPGLQAGESSSAEEE